MIIFLGYILEAELLSQRASGLLRILIQINALQEGGTNLYPLPQLSKCFFKP